jgi:hypothetical protein
MHPVPYENLARVRRMVQCNYPGCNEHSMQLPILENRWKCDRHVLPIFSKQVDGHKHGCAQAVWLSHHKYLPSRHPHWQNAPKCDCGGAA